MTLVAYIGPIAALLGVLLGGLLTTRTQIRLHAQSIELQELKDKQDACVEFLAAIRSFRRFAMYSPSEFDQVAMSENAKGVVTFDGRAEYDSRMDAAAARLMIVVHSDEINALINEMRTAVNSFIRSRAEYGKGKVPNEVIKKLQLNEYRFAQLCVKHLFSANLALDPKLVEALGASNR